MKVYVIRDSAFTLSQGKPASDLLSYEAFAKRYLSEFSEVVLVARLFDREDSSTSPATGPHVSFVALPGYHGPRGFLKKLPSIVKVIFGTLDSDAAYILRVPTTVPSLYAFALWLKRIPFAVEVAADPYDGYSKNSLNGHPFASVFRWCFVKLTEWQCKSAAVSAYVTNHALQRRYPPRPGAPTYAFTSIDLTVDAYLSEGRSSQSFNTSKPHLVLVGNMQKSLKGHDVLLRAMKVLKDQGRETRLTIVGHGENQAKYASMAEDFGLDVSFTGKLQNGAPIRQVLDTGDIFVLPSRQEGLPRALLEAMARGLPAVATRVGGTSELLPDDSLVESEDHVTMAKLIAELSADPAKMAAHSNRNLGVARRYTIENVQKIRNAFYKSVIDTSK